MSFLASLRHREAENTQDFVLCYQLSTNPTSINSAQLMLHLMLTDAKTLSPKTAKDYQLQREHLLHPPAFLDEKDREILGMLSDAQSDWFQQSTGQLPEGHCEEILHAIVASTRCKFLIRNHVWRSVILGPQQTLHAYWFTNHNGDQLLRWHTSAEHEHYQQLIKNTQQKPTKKISKKKHQDAQLDLFSFGDETQENNVKPIAQKITGKHWVFFNNNQAITVYSDTGYYIGDSPLEISLAVRNKEQDNAPLHTVISADELTKTDLTKTSTLHKKWHDMGLPTPATLAIKKSNVEVKPLLHFVAAKAITEHHSENDTEHKTESTLPSFAKEHLQLKFSLCDKHYCTLPSSINATTQSYWNGHELIVLEDNGNQQEDHAKDISELFKEYDTLDDFHNIHPVTAWQPQDANDWQKIFSHLYIPLKNHNVEFIIERNFSHHYIRVENWQVNIRPDESSNEDNAINLSITLHSDNEKVDLSELIAQLHDFNTQNGHTPTQFHDANGKIWLLPAGEFSNLMEELEDLTISNEGFKLSHDQAHRLATIQQQLPEQTQFLGDTEQLEKAISLHQSPVTIEGGLGCVKAELRSYQWLGVCWIQHLKQHNCNGLLADDMGLGKTLQTLTHLAFEHQQKTLKHPALIVVPLSLVHNWSAEIQRFAPQLRYRVIHGGERHKLWGELDNYDVLITTYHLVVADLNQWQQQTLSWLILDEAQHIKNPSTRFSQALREVPSEHRLCLSGTPVENHLGELWSIMSFLMPGSLGTQKTFRQQFQRPIEGEGNGKRLQQLLQRVSPFMLRRTKDQIATDLPEKTEISQLIPFEGKQRDFYEQLKHDTWQELQSKLEDEPNSGQHHIAALTALMKLRQACCDPQLLNDKHTVESKEQTIPSAKRDYCLDMIAELVAEKRAVLVFSQFTQMLEILADALHAMNIPSLMLTGKSRERQQLVDDFQAGKAPVFLISLKAGGTGLNLTRADTVIHYDPWWNSAAQKQASDRAHRIGQDKPVFVYKLIAENTIEEKIEQLQTKKATLSEHVDNQAQLNAETFAFKFEELLELWHEDGQRENSQKEES